MALTWLSFTDYLDGSRPILKAERDELWSNLDVLLASCGGRWRLKTADMDAIKAAGVITDLTSLEDPDDTTTTELGNLAKVLIDIEDVFHGTSGLDAFKAVRADEGLTSDAQLAEFVDATGRITQADTFHLWNLYRRVLDYLQCCITTIGSLTIASRYCNNSASRTCTLEEQLADTKACLEGVIGEPTELAYNRTLGGICPEWNWGALMAEGIADQTILHFICPHKGKPFRLCYRQYAVNNVGRYLLASGSIELTPESDDTESITMADLSLDLSVEQLYSYAAASTPDETFYYQQEARMEFEFDIVAVDDECP